MTGREAMRLALATIAGDYASALGDGVLVSNLRSIPMFRASQYYGMWRGFAQRNSVSDELKRRFYYPALPRSVQLESLPGNPIDYSRDLSIVDAPWAGHE